LGTMRLPEPEPIMTSGKCGAREQDLSHECRYVAAVHEYADVAYGWAPAGHHRLRKLYADTADSARKRGTSVVLVRGSVPGTPGLIDPAFLRVVEFAGVA
jgi:hypothetical protein